MMVDLCTTCGMPIDTETGIGHDRQPREDDLSTCLYCGSVKVRHAEHWVAITDDELIELPLNAKKLLARIEEERKLIMVDLRQRKIAQSLVVWTVYQNPTDYPGHWVVRAHDIPEGARPACTLHDTLAGARAAIPPGLTRFPRQAEDDSVIYETWL